MKERDKVIADLAHYTAHPPAFSENALFHAKICFLDAIGCAYKALEFPECRRMLGPLVPGMSVQNGLHVLGTDHSLDPLQAAFQNGALIRWLDYNDTFLAKEWAHPSDNLGALIPVCELQKLTLHDLFVAMIQAYEIQGSLALMNSFNAVGLDHVILVKIASAAVCTRLLGGTEEQIADAISQAFIDLGPLRTYRHAPNTGMRKSWAAGDAAARGLELAFHTLKGEKGYLTPLTAPKWGLQDVMFQGKPIQIPEKMGSYIIENILFKVKFPAEFHAQTAVEIAASLHAQVKGRLQEISSIDIETHEAAIRIIDKKGPLHNHADRDHCLQYMTAVALMNGTLTSEDYSDQAAQNPLIDHLRALMTLKENPQFSKDYLDPDKRSIANRLTIHFKDGSSIGPVTLEFPIGHKQRRKEALPLLKEKFLANSSKQQPHQVARWVAYFDQPIPASQSVNIIN